MSRFAVKSAQWSPDWTVQLEPQQQALLAAVSAAVPACSALREFLLQCGGAGAVVLCQGEALCVCHVGQHVAMGATATRGTDCAILARQQSCDVITGALRYAAQLSAAAAASFALGDHRGALQGYNAALALQAATWRSADLRVASTKVAKACALGASGCHDRAWSQLTGVSKEVEAQLGTHHAFARYVQDLVQRHLDAIFDQEAARRDALAALKRCALSLCAPDV